MTAVSTSVIELQATHGPYTQAASPTLYPGAQRMGSGELGGEVAILIDGVRTAGNPILRALAYGWQEPASETDGPAAGLFLADSSQAFGVHGDAEALREAVATSAGYPYKGRLMGERARWSAPAGRDRARQSPPITLHVLDQR